MIVGWMKYPVLLSPSPPAMIFARGVFLAREMYPMIESKAFSSITALTKQSKSRTSPTLIRLSMPSIFSLISGQRDKGMYAREQAEHFCPWYSNAPRIKAVAA